MDEIDARRELVMSRGFAKGALTQVQKAEAALEGDGDAPLEMARARGMVKASITQVLKTEDALDAVLVEPEPVDPPPVVEEPVEPEPEPEPPVVDLPDAASFIVGPQVPIGESPWPFFDANMTAHPDKLWGTDGRGLKERSHGYYYDAALVQYTLHARSGSALALERARELADYWYEQTRTITGGFAPREAALAGLMLRAMDGRPDYWPLITSEMQRHWGIWLGPRLARSNLHYGVRDGGYTLLFAAQISQAHPDEATRDLWRRRALEAATTYYARLQYPNGGWYWVDSDAGSNAKLADGTFKNPDGRWEQPFQIGLLLEAFVAVHQITADSTIAQSIVKAVDHLWSTYRKDDVIEERPPHCWRDIPYYAYTDGSQSATTRINGDTNKIRDQRQRNSLIVHAFGYALQLTGDDKYRSQGDEIFAATYGNGQGPGADPFYGLSDYRGKEYCQGYRSAGRFLAWRV